MRKLFLIALELTAATPAAAQSFTGLGLDMGSHKVAGIQPHQRVENFANCVVRADTAGALAYVRTEHRSAAERGAIAKLAPAYAACRRHLTRWGGTFAYEAQKRDAILVALHHRRDQLARRD